MRFKDWLQLNEAPKDTAFQQLDVPYDARQRYGPTGRYGTPAPELSRAFHMLPAGIGAAFNKKMFEPGTEPGVALGGEFPDDVEAPDSEIQTGIWPLMHKENWGKNVIYRTQIIPMDRDIVVDDQFGAEAAARMAAIEMAWWKLQEKLMQKGWRLRDW